MSAPAADPVVRDDLNLPRKCEVEGASTRAEGSAGLQAKSLEHERRPAAIRYAGAAAAILVALAVRAMLQPVLGERLPLVSLIGAVAISVWWGGLWPAVWAAILGYATARWAFTAPGHEMPPVAHAYAAVLYSIGVGLVIAMGTAMRRAQAQAHRTAQLAIERQQHAERALRERDCAESRARESDERLRTAIRTSRVVLTQSDGDLRYRWIHHPDTAFEASAVLGRRDDELGLGTVGERLVAAKRDVLRTGRGTTLDETLPVAGGDRTYTISLEPLRDPSGAVVGVAGSAFDITDRKRAEEALRASEERARQQYEEMEAIYDAAPVGIAILDTSLRFRRINKRLAEINGRPVAEHIDRTVAEVVPAFSAQAALALRRVIDTDQPLHCELYGKTGAVPEEERIFDEHWSPLRNAEGAIVAVAVIAEDVTDRRRSEHKLRESEELFRALAENVPQLAWMARPDGTVFWHNRRWYEFTGATAEQLQELGWACAQHPDHLARVTSGFRRAMEAGKPWEDTFPLRGKEGRFRWFLCRAFPIRGGDGRITRWFGTNTDVTVLRDTQDALRDAQRQVRQYAGELERTVAERTAKLKETVQELEAFSYSIAHDMRAPLRSMIGYADMVREEHSAGIDETGREYLTRISVSARRLDRLIQDVLNYSRIVRDELPIEAVDVRQLVAEVVEGYPDLAAAKDTIEIDANLPVLRGNRAALTQVFSNLLGNAIKFVPKNTPPLIRVFSESSPPPSPRVRGKWARVSIEDNGIGIDPSVRPRLFQMFQRFTRPGLYEGTGMGLAIARKAMDRMGGVIGVDSVLGRGSRFWIILPVGEIMENRSNAQP